MASPMPPEPSAEDWARAESDYAARERERNALTIERVLDAHKWQGGYFCACHRAINSTADWARHVLWAALEPDD